MVEDGRTVPTTREHVVDHIDRGARVDVGVPGEQVGDVGQGVAGPGRVEGDGEQEAAVVLPSA